jgi:hypothetical protein
MERKMKAVFQFCGVLLALLLVGAAPGCGTEDGQGPVLQGLQTDLNEFPVGFGNGSIDIKGTVDFFDPDGDLVILRAVKRDCGVGEINYIEWLKQDLLGVTSGTLSFLMPVSTDCPRGRYSITLYALDGRGNHSNEITVPYALCQNLVCD